jgi:glycine/D-amino acid oxidase-like deaminating enzyme
VNPGSQTQREVGGRQPGCVGVLAHRYLLQRGSVGLIDPSKHTHALRWNARSGQEIFNPTSCDPPTKPLRRVVQPSLAANHFARAFHSVAQADHSWSSRNSVWRATHEGPSSPGVAHTALDNPLSAKPTARHARRTTSKENR